MSQGDREIESTNLEDKKAKESKKEYINKSVCQTDCSQNETLDSHVISIGYCIISRWRVRRFQRTFLTT